MLRSRVREIATAQHYNISTLSDKAGVSWEAVSRLFRPTVSRIDGTTVDRVCRVLNVGVGDLFYLDPAPEDTAKEAA